MQRAVTESGVVSTLRKEADSAHSTSRQSKAVPAANSDLSAGKMAALGSLTTVVIFNRTAHRNTDSAQWAGGVELEMQISSGNLRGK